MENANPAVSAQTRIPPALLEAVADDPAVGRRMFRKMMMVQADRLHRLSLDPNTSHAIRLQIAEWFSKNADFVPRAVGANASAGAPSAILNINFSGDMGASKVAVEMVQEVPQAEQEEPRALETSSAG